MKSKKLHRFIIVLHQYIGLAVGLLLIVVGLTGSLLVFGSDLDHFLLHRQIGPIIPQGERVSVEVVLDQVRAEYKNQIDFKLDSVDMPRQPDEVYNVWLRSKEERWTVVSVHPYTAAILGTRQWEQTLIGFLYRLHYELLAGEVGLKIVGIVALLLFMLSITGILLWSGWRKLISGFKIKWKAHRWRVSFDLHKVVGITVAVFLSMIAFTGFCWNFYEFAEPAIYAATLTPKPAKPVSQLIAGQSPLKPTEILQKANIALPGAIDISLTLPDQPDGVYRVRKKLPQETEARGRSFVYLDQYSGKVVQLQNGLQPSLGDRVLNSFTLMHYGTFGGLPTRILYVFVGFAPLILFITGFVIWWYRPKSKRLTAALEPVKQRRA